jgi:hypothetical protein
MLKNGVGLSVPVRGLLLLGSLILLPAWARADDFSFSGDATGCSDPPVITQQFNVTPNPSGGLCLAFGNHSGTTFKSLKFTTAFPNANPNDALMCSPQPFFLNCDFNVDGVVFHNGDRVTAGNIITVEFFGLNADHIGIPDAGAATDNFFINLNNPDPTTGQQPHSNTAAGDWLLNGVSDSFAAAANGVPEPGTWILLLAGVGALLARARLARNGPSAN